MKKIKEEILDLLQVVVILPPSTPVSTPFTTTSSTPSTPLVAPTTPSFTISSTLLGTGAVAVVIVADYFYINRKKPVPTKPADQAQPKKDAAFFHMQ